jgi:hypothetical protein
MSLSSTSLGSNKRRYGAQSKGSNTQAITKAQVRQMINASARMHIERKFCDFQNSTGVDYNGSVDYLLRPLARGDTSTEATGNLIRVRRVEVRGVVATNQTHSSLRLIVFKWLDSSHPVASGILESLGSNLSPYSPMNIENNHKIKILCDRSITIFPVAGSYAAKKFEMLCDCDDEVQLPANIPSNSAQLNGLFFLYVSDDIVPAYPQLFYQSRCIFEDA